MSHCSMRPCAHDADLVGDRERFVLVVRDEDRGRVLLLEDVAHFEAQALAQVDVEVGERLVEQQQLGPRRERARERDALLLAAGELVRIAVATLVAARRCRAALRRARHARAAASARRPKPTLSRDREMRKQRVVLEHHADAAALGRNGAVPAGSSSSPCSAISPADRLESGDAAQHRGLAAAARAEQAADRRRPRARTKARPARGRPL